jgi:hypothetical protein
MRLLLDTHTFLWYYSGSPELSDYARQCPKFTSFANLGYFLSKNHANPLPFGKGFFLKTIC